MGKAVTRAARLFCRIDVTAFASVMFALVALFAFAATEIRHQLWLDVELPRVNRSVVMQGAIKEDALVVAVHRDGKIFLGSERIHIQRLSTEIRNRLNRGAENKVYIRADAWGKYGDVHQVVNAVQAAGVENIGFIVEERRTQ